MLRVVSVLGVLSLAACENDFSLQMIPDHERGADDVDTGLFEELVPDDEPEDTGSPAEPEPEPEEEEEIVVEEEEPPEDDCLHTDDRIYVIDRDNEQLSLFDPETLEFTTLGRLSCPSGTATPGSMAVSRSGSAYVRYSDDKVYVVSLDDLSCERTGYRSGGGFGSFGMGYASDEAGTWREQLYVADADQVARMDTDAWSVDVLGGMASQSELTGNSAGELWAFLPLESPAVLAEIDKDSGQELQRIRLSGFPSLSDIDTFAFAAWGGEFWLFVRTYGMGSSTDVYRVGSDGRLERLREDVGFDVVGAGVSTCAPSE